MSLDQALQIPTVDGPVSGTVKLPGSKSYTNRVLPLAALASGRSTIHGVLDSDDTRYMVAALEQLGIDVSADWSAETVEVSGADGSIPNPSGELFLGNSGTSMRFLAAVAALGHGRYRLDGVERMRSRPVGPLLEGLQALGVNALSEAGNGCPPVVIETIGIEGGPVTMNGSLSSQYFTALAMVMPYATSPVDLRVEGDLVSKPYLDITASAMAAFGVTLNHENFERFWVTPGQRYSGREYDVEPDASSASYFFALAAVTGGSITVRGLPWTSAQGDLKFVEVLERMGCTVERGADLTVIGPDRLSGVDIDMNAISDTVMSLAAIAPFASGPVTIRNVEHIRHKETDRISAIATELGKMGIQIDERADGLTIHPGSPEPAVVETYDDHRMAMAFAITGTRAAGIRIQDPGCVSKTVPRFWDILFPLLGGGSAT